jgi:8-oxo-dGTP pyrophosphatase MutT (NUDIX family)
MASVASSNDVHLPYRHSPWINHRLRTVCDCGEELGMKFSTSDFENPRAALLYYENVAGALLSVWNRKHHVWGMPGGKVELNETLDEALKREIREETGLNLTGTDWIYQAPTYTGSGRMCYVSAWNGHTGNVRVTGELNSGIGWMSRKFLCSQERYGVGEWYRKFFLMISR